MVLLLVLLATPRLGQWRRCCRRRLRRATAIRGDARGVGAAVLGIRDTIAIPVGSDRRTTVVGGGSGCSGAVVRRVGNAVAVLIPWGTEEEVPGELVTARNDLGSRRLDEPAEIARILEDRQAELQVGDRNRGLAVGCAAVWSVAGKKLELRDVVRG